MALPGWDGAAHSVLESTVGVREYPGGSRGERENIFNGWKLECELGFLRLENGTEPIVERSKSNL